MAGIIKVNQYQDFNGNTILTSDGSGNLTTQKINYPAFNLVAASTQSLNDSAVSKITLATTITDTNNACSDSKFTVPSGEGGLYCIGGQVSFSANCNSLHIGLYVNGNFESNGVNNWIDLGDDQSAGLNIKYLQLSAGDYVELYALQISGGARTTSGSTTRTGLYGFRIGS